MKKMYLIAVVLASGALLAPLHSMPAKTGSSRASEVDVAGNDLSLNYKNVTELNLYGDRNTITIRGRCNTLNVLGNHNTVVVQRCDAMALNGDFNRITSNVIQNIDALGNDNKVVWRNSTHKNGPNISSLGSRNSIVRTRR